MTTTDQGFEYTRPTYEVLDVDPTTLAIATNVRDTAVVLDEPFVESIRERGVLEPVIAYRAQDGALTVLRGQRRTLAAVKAELPAVPVLVVPEPDHDSDRVVDQLAENVHRAAMTTGETARAVEQLAAFGISAAQIAKRTALPKAQVRAALGTARSKLAAKAGDRYDFLTLEHTEAIAEFEDDADAVKALTLAAKDGQFKHTLQRLRDARAERVDVERVRAELAAAGPITLLDEHPSHGDNKTATLEALRLTPEEHQGCKGHAAWVFGGFAMENGQRTRRTHVRYYCTNWPKYGHKDPYAGTSSERKGPMSEEEKAERRELIENNKAWASACEVRRSWLFSFVQRKAAPAGAELFVYRELLHLPYQLRSALDKWGKGAGHQSFRDIMGLDRDADPGSMTVLAELDELLAAAEHLPAKRATLLTAAMLLCAWHAFAGPNTWRSPSAQDVRILRQMQAWDYPLADIEALALRRYEEQQAAQAGRS